MARKTPTAEQGAIIGTPSNANVLVVAGAGSGKTYTMTERIIHLIQHGVQPQQILGLTFTRKAAAELLNRVSAAVNAHRDGQSPTFLQPEVLTYDAFFQGIVRQYGLLVGFDQTMQPISDAGARQILYDVVDNSRDLIFEHAELFTTGKGEFMGFADIVRDVYELSSNIATSMIGTDCDSYEAAIARIREWDDEWIAQLIEIIGEHRLIDESEYAQQHKKPRKPSTRSKQYDEKMEQWRAQMHQYNAGVAVMDAINHTITMCRAAMKRNVLLTLVERYQQEKRRRHMAEFGDFTVAAFQLVSRFPSIGARYRARYTHVLLDEYQDTSTTQASLIASLFHTDDSQSSAVGAVGDPFQSIYAWRGASPGAFRMLQRAFDMPINSEPLPITLTRRNPKLILEAANHLTANLRRTPSRLSSATMREVDVLPLRNLDTAPDGTLGMLGYETRGQQIDGVVRFVQQALAARRERIAQGEEDDTPGAHVAILARSNSSLPPFLEALRQVGIPAQIYGYSALLDMPEVVDMLALLRVVAFHTDSAPLMRLLSTPRFAMQAADLRALADLAASVNDDYRYRALVQAGLVEAGIDDAQTRRNLVREYRDRVADAIFLIDVLLRDDLPQLLDSRTTISAAGKAAVLHAAEQIRIVQHAMYGSVQSVVRAAAQALELDIDTVVASAMRAQRTDDVDPSVARGAIDGLLQLVTTYTNELADDRQPTLRGFIAWTDSLTQASVDMDDGGAGDAANSDGEAEVVLMTVHKAKGLEWDAVAVVDMSATKFPSTHGGTFSYERTTLRGENHLAEPTEDAETGLTRRKYKDADYQWILDADESTIPASDAQWDAPEYVMTTRVSWLDQATAVPVPVRVDATILPKFPADAADDEDPLSAMARLSSVSLIDQEVSNILGPYRDVLGTDEFAADLHRELYMTQEQEFGSKDLDEERRLMYVALTRAKYEALLTYSRRSGERDVNTEEHTRGTDITKLPAAASPFWIETFEAMRYNHDAPRAWRPTNVTMGADGLPDGGTNAQGEPARGQTPANLHAHLPVGYFIGHNAQTFMDHVVGDAWNAPVETTQADATLPWPCPLSPAIEQPLQQSVQAVSHARNVSDAQSQPSDSGSQHDSFEQGSLLTRAIQLLADEDLSAALTMSDTQLDQHVERRAMKALAHQRMKVTTLQHNDADMDEEERREYFRAIVRPIPTVSSPSAQAGTRFHAWAEQYLTAGPASGVTREELAARIGHDNAAGKDSPAARRFATWQRRFVSSRWAQRELDSAEESITMALPIDEILGTQDNSSTGMNEIVPGKLDAVFRGDINGNDPAHKYTIIDWKTGKRPVEERDIAEKLRQLDLYRLLLAATKGVELDCVDASLYYLSESREENRELHALPRSRAEILAELRASIPRLSDND